MTPLLQKFSLFFFKTELLISLIDKPISESTTSKLVFVCALTEHMNKPIDNKNILKFIYNDIKLRIRENI